MPAIPYAPLQPRTPAQPVLTALLLLALVLLAGLLTSPLLQVFGIDREVFRYTGMAMGKGQELYKDIFDHKPPVIHLVYAATSPFGPWGDWLFFRLLQWMAAWLLYRTATGTNPRAAMAICLLWVLLMNYPPVVMDGGNTRELCANLVLLLLCTGYREGRLAFVWMGLLAGLVFFTQPNELLPLAPLLLWFLFHNTRKQGRVVLAMVVKRALQFTAGLLLPVAAVGGWLLATHNFNNFIYHAFSFNTQWYIPSRSVSGNLLPVLHKLRVLQTGWLALTAIALGLLLKTRPWMVAALAASLALTVASTMLGHNFNHYYTAFVPAIIMLALMISRYNGPAPARRWAAWLATPGLTVLLCAGGYWYSITHPAARNYWVFERHAGIAAQLESVKGQPGQLFSFINPPALQYNTRYGITSPSRWVYQHFWRWPQWDADFHIFQEEVLNRLDSFHTRFVLYHETDLRPARPQLVYLWEEWLHQRYTPIITQTNTAGDTLRLYQRNTGL